jgi:hypothetical protein
MRGQDRLNAALQRAAFHDDAQVDCGIFAGGPDAYVDFAQGFLAKLEASQHLVGQADIEVSGNCAYGEIYFISWHRLPDSDGARDLIVAGRYIDEYSWRNAVGWRISRRRELIDWSRTDPAADQFIKTQLGLHFSGRRGSDFSETRDW